MFQEFDVCHQTSLIKRDQPSSQVFNKFKSCWLRGSGYVPGWFASANYPCSEDFNPADHTVQTFAVKPGSEDECRQRISAILENVKESESESESVQTIRAEIKTIENKTAENEW